MTIDPGVAAIIAAIIGAVALIVSAIIQNNKPSEPPRNSQVALPIQNVVKEQADTKNVSTNNQLVGFFLSLLGLFAIIFLCYFVLTFLNTFSESQISSKKYNNTLQASIKSFSPIEIIPSNASAEPTWRATFTVTYSLDPKWQSEAAINLDMITYSGKYASIDNRYKTLIVKPGKNRRLIWTVEFAANPPSNVRVDYSAIFNMCSIKESNRGCLYESVRWYCNKEDCYTID